jgi:hypothetical protein
MLGVSKASTLVRWVESCGGALVSVVFPADCRLCKQLLTRASRIPICGECLAAFQKVSAERCVGCGQPWLVAGEAEGREQICRECRGQKYAFDAARSYGIYEGALARAIVLMKYEKIEPLGTWFGKRLDEVVRAEGKRLEADIVVSGAFAPAERERAWLQPGGPFWQVAGPAPGTRVPAGAAEALQAEAGEAFAPPGGALGSGTWRFCHGKRWSS